MPDGDPYARMAALMRGGDGRENVRMYQGTVTRQTPLEVNLGGVRLPKDALRVNEALSLSPGDTVLMFSGDDQTFYIVMKVVEAG